jgi:hypothetical protein
MHSDSFHRLMKSLVDSGHSPTIEAAQAEFSDYGVRVLVSPDIEGSPARQIILLTVLNTAARSFQGNVSIEGPLNAILSVSGFAGRTLAEFCAWLGLTPGLQANPKWPAISIGGDSNEGSICPWADGWVFGVGKPGPQQHPVFAPACVAAGALAVSEAFSVLRKDNPLSGRRSLAFSLWSLSSGFENPDKSVLQPKLPNMSLVGLGHLGQAYCWVLGLMGEKAPSELHLQDFDEVTTSTLSTSVISTQRDVGKKKARVAAVWLEERGIRTNIIERRFNSESRVSSGEPHIALFGVDNPSARKCLEHAGFSLVIDAGLGSGFSDFRALRVRCFPGASKAAEIWADAQARPPALAPAYVDLLARGKDPCGIATLATRAVGAPFVGCYAGAVVASELIKRLVGTIKSDVIDVNLRAPLTVERA